MPCPPSTRRQGRRRWTTAQRDKLALFVAIATAKLDNKAAKRVVSKLCDLGDASAASLIGRGWFLLAQDHAVKADQT